MKTQVHPMMAAGVQAEPFVIQHVRQPGDRMPVARLRGRKCPADAFEGYSGLDVCVVNNVTVLAVIIIEDKTKVTCGPKGSQGNDDQRQTDWPLTTHGVLLL